MTDQNIRVAVPKEVAPGERRVALTPEAAGRLVKSGLSVTHQAGAGAEAGFPDDAYRAAGATTVRGPGDACAGAAAVLRVQRPDLGEIDFVPTGAVLVSFLQPARDAEIVSRLAARGVAALSMDLVPRITRAQPMDALSSQATVAGYKAVLLGAAVSPRFLPMLVTAAGTLPPATVLVLGAGVAGLQAIATARRLGANVRAYDIRPEVKEQVESLGATFVASEAVAAEARDAQGYAREVGEEVRRRQEAALAAHVAEADLVVTTAQVPGRRAPVLVTEAMVDAMKPGSVIVDLAADGGGNCVLTRPGEEFRTPRGVLVIGPLNLAATMPMHASQMYARNVTSVLLHLVKDGRLTVDREDEIVKAMLVTGARVR
jgi:NAD(P) transhydrogenase subunit alpha